ncbi:MAG: PQQ-binding-like beta-propeller repeat protein [Gammaproteobacteria bacterium]|nr:PQQ-binding-like beta-propeller repeat protein [Gammaproteobacteria bacterium]
MSATDWPLHGNDYGNRRYSELAQITTTNVAALKPAWTHRTGMQGSFQACPIVVDGVLNLTTPFNDAIALDAATGAERWCYRHDLRTKKTCCGPANRGAAVADGMVYMATMDARLIALDQATGVKHWDATLSDTGAGSGEVLEPLLGVKELEGAVQTGQTGISANLAPQVYGGLVFAGVTGAGYGLHLEIKEHGKELLAVGGLSGGRHGLRGFLAAFDGNTGREVWRWFTVPEQGWEGEFRATTPAGDPLHRDIAAERSAFARYRDTWRYGGGSVWTTPAIDPEVGLLYIGTGNPSPQMDDSTRTGKITWQHRVDDPMVGGALVTAGGLVFTGEGNGSFDAFDAASGRLLWQYRAGTGVNAPPITYAVGGKQYVAVAAGGNSIFGYKTGDELLVFAIPD